MKDILYTDTNVSKTLKMLFSFHLEIQLDWTEGSICNKYLSLLYLLGQYKGGFEIIKKILFATSCLCDINIFHHSS